MAWQSSDRRERLPANWTELRKQTKTNARGRCQADPHAPGCCGYGSDADHITPGDNHHPTNLQWLSAPCHRAKTARESAQRNEAKRAARIRPTETHPGRRTP